MKKTLTVNLNGIVFHIDDDAYEILHNYLSEIADHFQSDDEKTEIMNDIEARIAELFTEKLQKNKNVVSIEDVLEIIEIMGKPSQYADEDEPAPAAPKTDRKQSKTRRFYRDPENAVFGGIAGGISAYFGWDVTLIRILLVIAVFVGVGFIIPVYIVVWFVAPQAVTASQRLEMQGEDVTIDSIKTELNNAKSYVESEKFKQSANSAGNRMLEIIRVLFKVVFGFVGGVLGLVGVILVAVLVFVLFLLIFEPTFYNSIAPNIGNLNSVLTPENAILIFISLILVIGCPIFMLFYWGIRVASGRYHGNSKSTSLVVLILWLAGLFMFYSVGAKSIFRLNNLNGQTFNFNFIDDKSPLNDDVRVCDPFHAIEVSGNIELTLEQDSVQNVTVSTHSNFQPKVITRVENGVLKIYTEGFHFNKTIHVTVSADSITHLVAKGASEIHSASQLSFRNLSVELMGASQADLDVNIEQVFDVDVKGASEANLRGTAHTFNGKAEGASEMNASDLIAQIVTVYASGASDANVNASLSLDAQAYGASDIEFRGNPKTITKIAAGASSVEKE